MTEPLIWTKQQWFAAAFDFYVRQVKRHTGELTFEQLRDMWDAKKYPQPIHPNYWGILAREVKKEMGLTEVGRMLARRGSSHSRNIPIYQRVAA